MWSFFCIIIWRVLPFYKVYVCAGQMLGYITLDSSELLQAFILSQEVLYIQQNQHYLRCSSLHGVARAWRVIIFLLCFDSISITLLPYIAFTPIHTPSSSWPPNMATSSLSQRERHPARAANHWDQIKTARRLELQVLSALCIMSANTWTFIILV